MSIGVARMRSDGTIELDLRTGGGTHGVARKVVLPTDAEYTRILDHVGGLSPGEEKLVPPWPDPWDEARVEAAARAHAASKGWAPDEYRLTIMGTDADGNAVVTLAHEHDRHATRGPGGGRSVSLRIEPNGYTVVRELAFQ